MDMIKLDVYFDYLCPYVHRAIVWLEQVKAEMGPNLTISWCYFSLEQSNNKKGAQWKIWEQPENRSRGLLAFWASEAARQQGEDIFDRFRTALLKARHEQEREIADINVINDVAENVGLNISRFRRDIANRNLLTRLSKDHNFAVNTLGIFGTPTLVFAENQAIFLKLSEVPPDEESLSIFEGLHDLATQKIYIQELKRPEP